MVGVVEDAGVVEHGGAHVEGAELLRVLEGGGDARRTGGGVGVPAAERESVDDVWCRTGGGLGEKGRGRRGVPGEAAGEDAYVGLLGAALGVVPSGGVAELPRQRRRRAARGGEGRRGSRKEQGGVGCA